MINWGVDETQSVEKQRKVKIINSVILLAAAAILGITVYDLLLDIPSIPWLNFLFFGAFLGLYPLNYKGYHRLSIQLLVILTTGLIFFYSTLYGADNGSYLFDFLVLVCIPFVIDSQKRLQLLAFLVFVIITLFVSLYFSFPWQIQLSADIQKQAFIGNALQVGLLTILFVLIIDWSNKDVNARLRQAKNQVQTMLEHTSYYIWSVDNKIQLVQANEKFKMFLAHRFGLDPKAGTDMLSFMRPDLLEYWKMKYNLGLSGQLQEFVSTFEFQDGTSVTLEISLFAIKNEEGQITGVTIYGNNVTDKLQITEALKENRELLTDAMELARLGTWRSDLIKNEVYWDERSAQIFGVDIQYGSLTSQDYFERIHPDDLEEVKSKIQHFEQNGGEILLNHRIITPTGELKFIHEKASTRTNEKGEVVEVRGIIQDVTELREQQLLEERANYLLSEIKEATETLLVDSDFEHAFQQTIARASLAIGASYAWVFRHFESEYGPAAKLITPIADERVDQKERLLLERGLPYKKIGLDNWLTKLRAGESIVGQRAELPEKEQYVLHFFDIRSVLVLPIFVDNQFWGFVGFDNLNQEKKWWGLEEHILRGFCNALGGAISQQLSHRLLKEAKEAAEKATQIKSNFLSNISHEIRTPMNAIIGLTELLIPEEKEDQKLEYLQAVRFSADNLLRLINDLLDLSKIEADKLSLDRESFDLKEQLFHFEKTLGYIAKDKDLKIKMEVAEDVPEWVFGDSVRLNQILLNLGSNAIKFTPKGEIHIQVVLLSIIDDKHLIRFRVKDDGIGIEPDKIERIFDRFEQAEKYTSRQFGGTGLGLTITEKLVKLMGGKINVESEPKKGAIFTVELPFEPNSEVKPDAIKTEIQNAPNLKAARVLLVEDNNINVMLASRLLKMWGAQFDIAENGLEALDLLKSKDFDLVLLDIQMPIMNGFELIEKIRSKSIRPEISELPVIALTADAFDETRLRASELGFSDFITKPIKSGDLYQKMSRLLG